jgi:hypothetical protein
MVTAALSSPANHRSPDTPVGRKKRRRPNPPTEPPRTRISGESNDSAHEIEEQLTQPEPEVHEQEHNSPSPIPVTAAVPRFRSGTLHISYPSSSQPRSQAEASGSTSLYSTYPRLPSNSHIPFSTLGESQGAPRWRNRNSSLFDSTLDSQRGSPGGSETRSVAPPTPRWSGAQIQSQNQTQSLQLQTQAPYLSQTYSTDDSQ